MKTYSQIVREIKEEIDGDDIPYIIWLIENARFIRENEAEDKELDIISDLINIHNIDDILFYMDKIFNRTMTIINNILGADIDEWELVSSNISSLYCLETFLYRRGFNIIGRSGTLMSRLSVITDSFSIEIFRKSLSNVRANYPNPLPA